MTLADDYSRRRLQRVHARPSARSSIERLSTFEPANLGVRALPFDWLSQRLLLLVEATQAIYRFPLWRPMLIHINYWVPLLPILIDPLTVDLD